MLSKRRMLVGAFSLIVALILAACATGEVQTVVVTEVIEREGETVVETVIVEVTEDPAEIAQDTVIICMSQEPDSLHRINSNMAVTVQALMPADPKGWTNDRGYFYETQMLVDNELPSFENGGAEFIGEGADEQLVVTFQYKDNIVWSDGEPFTVDDLIYTREVILDENSGAVTRAGLDTLSLEKVDDYTIRVVYDPGVLNPLYFLPVVSTANGASAPIPEHVLSDMTPEEILDSDYARLPSPVLGPYQFVEWIEGDRIVLEKNPNWWGDTEQNAETVIFRFITDTNQLLAATLSGDCDLATSDGLQLTQVPFIQQSADQGLIQYQAIPATVWEHIDFNMAPPEGAERDALPFFGDVRVRQAIAYGTNRLQMTEQILYGEVSPLTSYLPSDHWAWNTATADLYPYDPDQAMALLEEAGWVDSDGDGVREASSDITIEYTCNRGSATIPAGTPFEVDFHTTTGNAMREQLSTLFQANMADIGIQINIDLLPASVWFGADGPLSQRTFQIGEFAWVSQPDPAAWFLYGGVNIYRTPDGTFVNGADLWTSNQADFEALGLDQDTVYFGRPADEELPEGYTLTNNEQIPAADDDLEGGNYMGWCNPEASQILFDGDNQIDPEVRLPFYTDFQTVFAEDVPSLPLFQRLNVIAYSPNLCGVEYGPSNLESWNVETWYFAESCE